MLQLSHKKAQKELLEQAVTDRMFRARNRHREVARVRIHATVDPFIASLASCFFRKASELFVCVQESHNAELEHTFYLTLTTCCVQVDYHGISVDEAMRLLYKKLEYLKANPDPGVHTLLTVHAWTLPTRSCT